MVANVYTLACADHATLFRIYCDADGVWHMVDEHTSCLGRGSAAWAIERAILMTYRGAVLMGMREVTWSAWHSDDGTAFGPCAAWGAVAISSDEYYHISVIAELVGRAVSEHEHEVPRKSPRLDRMGRYDRYARPSQ